MTHSPLDLQIPCCKTMMLRHSNLSTSSTADTRLSLSSLVRGGRGVWQTKQGTVLHFNMKRRQWQVSRALTVTAYLWTPLCSGELEPGDGGVRLGGE